ncbi:penicillin-binding protein 2 [Patescibacteria group bacterium]
MGLKKYFIKNKVGESIEAEEVFLDAEAARAIEEKGKMEQPIKKRNFILFYFIVVVCLFSLLCRAGYLQVINGEHYKKLAQGNKLRHYPIVAPRGIIYDTNENPLVYNVLSFNLVIDIVDFLDNDEFKQKEILEKIVNIVSKEENEILLEDLVQKIEQAKDEFSQLILLKDIEKDSALALEALSVEWMGARVEKSIVREYIDSSYFSHILGYTGDIGFGDLEKYPDYFLSDKIGKMGLELQYEGILRGIYGGRNVEVNSVGEKLNLISVEPALPGESLVTHIDKDLQIKLYQLIKEMLNKLKLKRAVGVAMDPRDGGVLALVNFPSFDNNLFSRGISKEDLDRLGNDPNQPFLNRAISGQYPSGSIIKPLIAAAALEENIISPSQKINCTGLISIANKYSPEIIYKFPDWKTHGFIDIIEAIAQSCNVFFYTIGGGYDKVEGLGMDRIKEYLQYFGLGQLTNIDLPNKSAGLIPDEEWKKSNKPDEEWNLGDTYHASIGQGDILVTPIQMASSISAIANGGILYQPQLVDKIINLDSGEFKDISPVVVRDNFISYDNLNVVKKGMRKAVISGSACSMSNLSIKVAGKTGTAQFGTDQMHSWFVGFAPYEDPQIVLTILIEEGGEGHEAAVPVAKDALEWYFNKEE